MFAPGAPDPFLFYEIDENFPGYSYARGKTEVSSIISAPSTTKTVIIGGQSNHATTCGNTVYSTVSGSANQLSIYDGGIYAGGDDPVLGCSYSPGVDGVGQNVSSVCMRFADEVISAGKATRCIVVPIAIAGTAFGSWVPSASKSLFTRYRAAILRCRARGLEPDAIICGQGETDNLLGTSSADVKAAIWAIVDGIRALNCTAPFYAGLFTMLGGSTSATVRTGITNSVDAGRNIILGYDADTNLTVAGGFRIAPSNTHLSTTGVAGLATGWRSLVFP